MEYVIEFNSERDTKDKYYHLACGFISETTIVFKHENVKAVIHAKGDVKFFDMNDNLIAAGKAPSVVFGRGLYEDISCQVKDNRIELLFPIYDWVDYYPNCDGEYDRWGTDIVGHHTFALDLKTKTIAR